MARQETGKRVEDSLRQRLVDTAVRNVDMPVAASSGPRPADAEP